MPHFECGAFNRSATSPVPWNDGCRGACRQEGLLATELPRFTAEGPPYPRVAGAVNARHRIQDDLAWRFARRAAVARFIRSALPSALISFLPERQEGKARKTCRAN
jgi:hypothetical protein